MAHFYRTLPSNSSMNYYPENTLTKYVTKLHSSMSLDGEWEVGLAEISFPRSWYTVNKGGGSFDVERIARQTSHGAPYRTIESNGNTSFRISTGYYDTVQDVLKAMNDVVSVPTATNLLKNAIPQKSQDLKFRFNEVNKKVIVHMQEHQSI